EPQQANAIAAAMAAELATAPWSETCEVCLIGVADELEPLERVQVLPADSAVAELVRLARSERQSGLVDAAHGDIPAALTIAVVGAGALPADELAALVAAARPHNGLAVIAATPAPSGIAGRFRLVCDQDGSALLYPLGLTVTPAQPHTISQQLVELLAATAAASDVPLNADGSAPPAVETAEDLVEGLAGGVVDPAADDHEDGEVAETEPFSDTGVACDGPPRADDSASAAVEPDEERATNDNNDGEVAETEALAAADISNDATPRTESGAPAAAESAEETETSGTSEDDAPDSVLDADGAKAGAPTPVAEVRLLGPLEITWQHKTPKRQVSELVSYLAVHPRGVSSDEARLALWPTTVDDDTFGERAPATFWALTTKARGALGD